MNLEPFTGPGSTPSRRRFWDKVTQVVIASQKVAGDNVSVDEHQGSGTIINVPFPERGRAPVATIGACCYNDGTCDDLTEADCNDAEGNWQGPGTTCADDPNPCVGACCEGEGGATCVDDSTPDSCSADGGIFQDFGSTCDPDPCGGDFCCCGLQTPFEDPDNPGNFYTTATNHCDGSQTYSGPTTEDSLYSHYEEHFTCCDPATGHLDIVQDDFCDFEIDPPGCDNTFDCDPFDCVLDCVGGSSFEGSQTISNPVTGPSCITSPFPCAEC